MYPPVPKVPKSQKWPSPPSPLSLCAGEGEEVGYCRSLLRLRWDVSVEPLDDAVQAQDAAVWPAAPRQVVALLGEAHELGGLAQAPQRDEPLLGLFLGA